jgi:hypothetical protein
MIESGKGDDGLRINVMNGTAVDLDQTDEASLTDEEGSLTDEEVSDEALEAAATGADSFDRKNSTPQCCSFGRC